MRTQILAIAVALPLVVSACDKDQLKYDPAISEIKGTLVTGRHEHANGEYFRFYAIKLDKPMSIQAGEPQSYDAAEQGVKEVQVYDPNPNRELERKLEQLVQQRVVAKGTIIHEFNAWHVRPLVMAIQDVSVAQPQQQ